MLVVGILPEGNIFGTIDNDEFSIYVTDQEEGVFKRFEYLSLPFSILDQQDLFKEILVRASVTGTSFKEELEKDSSALEIKELMFEAMDENSEFSRQVMDYLLSRVYVDDNILSGVAAGNSLEEQAAKVAVVWKQLADFYCIEGLVGGDGERNPFVKQSGSFVSGGLDSVELNLPAIRTFVHSNEWNRTLLQLSSIVGRDYKQIDSGVDVIQSIYGENDITEEEAIGCLDLIAKLSEARLDTNGDVGRFYNSLIRFHNWLPLALKSNGPKGETYNSVSDPAQKAIKLVDYLVTQKLEAIKDADSPKGLAIASLIDQGFIGDRELFVQSAAKLEDLCNQEVIQSRTEFSIFDFRDHTLYSGLSGGKWKGLKLLYDAKELLGLDYDVPEAVSVTSICINRILNESGITPLTSKTLFQLSDSERAIILGEIDKINLDDYLDMAYFDGISESLVVRSSMYGEDGKSNFSGTYDSFACDKDNLSYALKKVIKSYFSEEAVKSREEVGLSHLSGISVVVQERKSGIGGVIHLTDNSYSASIAGNPEKAVSGDGTEITGSNLYDITTGTVLHPFTEDLLELQRTFGDIDLEFVFNQNKLYLIQMRPKYKVTEELSFKEDQERIKIYSIDELAGLELDQEYILQMTFLNGGNIMDRAGEIMDFIRHNKRYIVGIEGRMPSVAHIPNKIEGHFRIPYRRIEND